MQKIILLVIIALISAPLSAGAADSPKPVGRWIFNADGIKEQTVTDNAGSQNVRITGPIELANQPIAGIVLNGSSGSIQIEQADTTSLPARDITVEAWVSVNSGTTWGGIAGYIQDNGSYEKGWLLGYNQDSFNFSVSTDTKLQYMSGKTKFGQDKWFHVAGTYDGSQLKLYVNGKLENSKTLSGDIAYPPKAFYEIGAYHDDNEHYRMNGMIHEVAVYNSALTEKQIEQKYDSKKKLFPKFSEPTLGPYLQFISSTKAKVLWETKDPSRCILEYGIGKSLDKAIPEKTANRLHEITITGLEPQTVYSWRIKTAANDQVSTSKTYQFDTSFNYTLPDWPNQSPYPDTDKNQKVFSTAERIIKETGITKGYCLVLGIDNGQLAYELAKRTQLRITCVDTDKDRLTQTADYFKKAGVYGTRISVKHLSSPDSLPFTKYFSNLIVSERNCFGNAAEMFRVLSPAGGTAIFPASTPFPPALRGWLDKDKIKYEILHAGTTKWVKITRSKLPGSGQWTHQYGNPDNSSNSFDTVGGASATSDLQVQWIGRPGGDFGADRNPRMPAPLSVNGRLYHQGLNRIIAMDSYNGAILWSMEVPDLLRVNMPRDSGPWCADDDNVYVTMKDKCWCLDGYTGRLVKTYGLPLPDAGREYDWGYIARSGGLLYGSTVKQGSRFVNIWGGGGEGWYDGKNGPTTEKVCSDSLFAQEVTSGKQKWVYTNGAIINSTITIGGGRICFVESRNPKVIDHSTGRIGLGELWSDQFLVALDAQSGKKLWEKSLGVPKGIVVFYMSYGSEKLFITSSASNKYNIVAFDARNGNSLWNAGHNWPSDNHSGHMQHPVVVGNSIYLEPCGYDINDGRRTTDKMGRHEGCATYMAISDALIYRGKGRQIAMWDMNTNKVTAWRSLRPSCWLSTIAADGMLLFPEGGGGCSCANWLQTSLGLVPVDK